MSVLHRFTVLLLFGLILAPFEWGTAHAGKWKDVSLRDTVVSFRNWPSTSDCRFRKRMADNYAMENTQAFCPRRPSRGEPSTYLWISELSPGFYWRGTKGKDIRQSSIFNNSSGWFYNFYGADFDSGQRFVCFRDTECSWRRVTFNVDGFPCQAIQIIPGVGGTNDFYGQRDSRIALTMVHCGTQKPIGPENIVYEDERIKLIYP